MSVMQHMLHNISARRHMYVCMYVCMYVRTYVCMYVCMYVCICMYVSVSVYQNNSVRTRHSPKHLIINLFSNRLQVDNVLLQARLYGVHVRHLPLRQEHSHISGFRSQLADSIDVFLQVFSGLRFWIGLDQDCSKGCTIHLHA